MKFSGRSGDCTCLISNMTESPKLVNVEYVLFDMDGLLLINTFFSIYFLTHTLGLLIDSERIHSIVTSMSRSRFFCRGRYV